MIEVGESQLIEYGEPIYVSKNSGDVADSSYLEASYWVHPGESGYEEAFLAQREREEAWMEARETLGDG